MAITLIKEDGTGLSNANTYASVVDCDAYHEAHLYAAAWTAASAGDKDKALAMATRLIDAEFAFSGTRKSTTQALQWPREDCPAPDEGGGKVVATNVVPKPVANAACEMARELIIADRTGAPMGEGLASTRLADSSIVFDKKDRRPVLTALVQVMLGKYGAPIMGGMARLVRT